MFARVISKLRRAGHRKKKLVLWLAIALVVLSAAVWNGWHWFGVRAAYLETGSSNIESNEISALEDISASMGRFGLVINKLGIQAPVIEDVDGLNKSAYIKALTRGVAHYKGTAKPGENGNIFIFGHSSTLVGTGSYAQIFASLNNLKKGDEAIINFRDKSYRYAVTSKKIVASDDVSVLDPTKSEQLTIMTCWPIGSNAKRLIVILKPKFQ